MKTKSFATTPLVSRLLLSLGTLFLTSIATSTTGRAASVWQNETDNAGEADYVVVQFPLSFSVNLGLDASPTTYGRIFEFGISEPAGAHSSVRAEVGWGDSSSDPRLSVWAWTPATFNLQSGNDDEYQASFLTPALAGTYSFTYRFSLDSGATWTLADLTGAGSNPGLSFSTADLGTFTVLNSAAIPEPATYGLFVGLGTLGVVFWRRTRAKRRPH